MSRGSRRLALATAFAMSLAAATAARAGQLLAPAASAARSALPGVSGVQRLRLDRAALADLRGQHHARVPAFPLGGGRDADLVLERFSPFAAGARAEVVGPRGTRTVALPDAVYFRGTVAGAPSSRVLLIAGRNRVRGFVALDGEVHPFGPEPGGAHRVYPLRQADPTLYPPPRDFCGNDLHPQSVAVPPHARLALPAPPPAAAGAVKVADVAVETDNELRDKFGSDGAALDYLASLLAAATAIYERDVAVQLEFSYIRLWDTTDPWTATSTIDSLYEVQDYWANPANGMDAIAGSHDLVHFVSGKNVQGGVAFLDVLCNDDWGFGVSQVFGSFDLSNPNQIWDVVVLTHELGHNFGSPHSHCYSPPLDHCYASEPGCYSGPVVASRGTLMSYCHTVSGGLSNIDLIFGDTVSARIGESVAAATCLADGSGGGGGSGPGGGGGGGGGQGGSTTTTTIVTDDADGDGVPDAVDGCALTPSGDMVDETGCPVCPCAGPLEGGAWSSRAKFLRCVRAEGKRRAARAVFSRADQRSAVRRARKSTCARPKLTRCCFYQSPDDQVGQCEVTRSGQCQPGDDTSLMRNIGAGSCTPPPCGR